jgi:predicted  nucleic acid-binding Zn-ribbon protein
MKASTVEQHRLLDVQELDTRLAQLAHRRRTLPESVKREELVGTLAELNTKVAQTQSALAGINRELTKADDEVRNVRQRIERDQHLIDSGSITDAKQITDLQHEVSSLSRRQTDLEDVEIDVMQQAEDLSDKITALGAEIETAQATLDQVSAQEAHLLTEIDGHVVDATADRADAASSISAELLALYEKIRSTSGIGAAPLVGGRCEGCHMQLAPNDLRTIEAAEPDDVLRCEECRCILVRAQNG